MGSTANYVTGRSRSTVSAAVDVIAEPADYADLAYALHAGGFAVSRSARSAEGLGRDSESLDAVVLYAPADRVAAIHAVRAARDALSDSPLVVIWPLDNAADARRALRAGADGLVGEAEVETTLMPTIRAVLSGLICVPSLMRAPLETDSLSMREKQVLGMLVMGFSNAEIAAKLFLAESTVKSHLSAAYTKLGVCSRKDAATMILDPMEGLGPGILAISAA